LAGAASRRDLAAMLIIAASIAIGLVAADILDLSQRRATRR
jgi:hypothetical protein